MITPDETPRLNIQYELGKTAMPKSWQNWFDALKAQGVDRLGDQSMGESGRRGWASFPAVEGLRRSWGPQPVEPTEQVSHEQWLQRDPAAQGYLKGRR